MARLERCAGVDMGADPFRRSCGEWSMTVQVDVIILSWNRATDTIAAIRSALEQRGIAKRVCILDQGSDPENLAALRAAVDANPEVILRELGRNVGVAEGRNLATALGSAPYVVALDNDAIFPDTATLARVVKRFESAPNLGALGFRILNYFTGRDDEMCWDYPRVPPSMADQEFEATRFIGAGHALRRTAFDAAGGYDAALFFAGEERDLSYRLLNLGFRIRYCPELAVLHKVDPEARVNWKAGRFYYTVRNLLYSEYKFGTPYWLILRAATLMTLKACRNGVPGQALRGVKDAIALSSRFRRNASSSRPYRLSEATRAHIRACEHVGEESLWPRIRRQFAKLPGSA